METAGRATQQLGEGPSQLSKEQNPKSWQVGEKAAPVMSLDHLEDLTKLSNPKLGCVQPERGGAFFLSSPDESNMWPG